MRISIVNLGDAVEAVVTALAVINPVVCGAILLTLPAAGIAK